MNKVEDAKWYPLREVNEAYGLADKLNDLIGYIEHCPKEQQSGWIQFIFNLVNLNRQTTWPFIYRRKQDNNPTGTPNDY